MGASRLRRVYSKALTRVPNPMRDPAASIQPSQTSTTIFPLAPFDSISRWASGTASNENTRAGAAALIARVRREASANPGSPSEALLEEFAGLAPATGVRSLDAQPLAPAVPLELDIGGDVLRLINMLTTFGTPQDVGVQELRVEMSFPADDRTESLLREWGAGGKP